MSRKALPADLVFAVALASASAWCVPVIAAANPASGHLYVADYSSGGGSTRGRVLEFPVASGIPANAPDIVLYTPYAKAVALGADGTLYVLDLSGVDVFAPHTPSGGAPEYTLELPFPATGLVVDAAGYVYVMTVGSFTAALVYSPKAQGAAQPVQVIYLPDGYGVFLDPMAITSFGALVTGDKTAILFIVDPIRKPTVVRQFCVKRSDGGIAQSDGVTFVAERRGISMYGTTAKNCPQVPLGAIRVINTPPLVYPTGVALNGGMVYTTDYSSSLGPRIVALPVRAGPQSPIAVVSGPQTLMSIPYDVKFGP